MDEKTEYARRQENVHRRKIVLPCVIPWEYGSNKYASQKGENAFGTNRNASPLELAIFYIALKIQSTKNLSESNDGVVPQITCPPLHNKRANQSGESSFGNFREQVMKVHDTVESQEQFAIELISQNGEERIEINKLVDDKMTKTILKKWNTPNANANSSDIGKRRDTVTESTGGRRFTKEEQIASRGCIPRFQDPINTIAAQDLKNGEGFQGGMPRQRQIITEIKGMDIDQVEVDRYMAWLGGQLTLQSQSQTGGFSKPRDVVSMNYYDKLQQERALDPKVIRKRLEEEKAKQEHEENGVEENNTEE